MGVSQTDVAKADCYVPGLRGLSPSGVPGDVGAVAVRVEGRRGGEAGWWRWGPDAKQVYDVLLDVRTIAVEIPSSIQIGIIKITGKIVTAASAQAGRNDVNVAAKQKPPGSPGVMGFNNEISDIFLVITTAIEAINHRGRNGSACQALLCFPAFKRFESIHKSIISNYYVIIVSWQENHW